MCYQTSERIINSGDFHLPFEDVYRRLKSKPRTPAHLQAAASSAVWDHYNLYIIDITVQMGMVLSRFVESNIDRLTENIMSELVRDTVNELQTMSQANKAA